MKVKKTIKIDKSNIEEISWYEQWQDGTLMVYLKPESTNGRRTLATGDYLCQFGNGMWQRFGVEALNRTFMNPAKEAGSQW